MATLCMALAVTVSAQTKTETFKVSGNCGMCKTKIEKAAKDAGAKEASWDVDSKVLTVTYKSNTTNAAKIQEKIAAVGYDNEGFKTTVEAYKKLHGCCQYDREAADTKASDAKASCCSEKCEMKDGKCTDMAACKEKGCCKDEATCKANGCCSDHKAMHGKMDCCKDGKCTMPGHDGKDCCKEGKCTMAGHEGKDCCKKDGEKMDCCKDGKCTKEGHTGGDCCKKS